ncbi:MAG: NADH-quinone oxidoreductase subunit NuoG [Bacteroidales bacterium]|nr:NADH-quinone oxidoreductase subunit NuoG [Bacteroidales bacterium]
MVKIQIDGKQYEVKQGKNLLEAGLTLGIDIPHFCYHPAMGSVGACRLCAVKKFRDADDKQGRIVMSCLEPVTEGMIIETRDDTSKDFRASVVEGLMTNHPHDCPVCDEGGECHLQDMTVMTGHNYRHFDFKKRTHNNQYLGPFIAHEMNRCIQCYRCVRFYRDYAGGKDLNVFSSHNHVYFGRHEEGTLESEFSGNLVEVCPTGVFTDKTFHKHFTRKWDLSNAPSVCTGCSVGCNIIVSERYGSLRRVMNRYNGAVNGYFICDRGRFGYEFVNDEKRIRTIKIRHKKNDNQEEAENETLISLLKTELSKDKRIIGIGSPRASIESNFALSTLVGKENFYHGISKKEHLLTDTILNFMKQSSIRTPSLKQMEKADAVLVLGEDLVNTAPMVALALRQSTRNKSFETAEKNGIPSWNDAPLRELAQDEKSPLFVITSFKDSLDEIAENSIRESYDGIANLGFAMAGLLDTKAPSPSNLNKEHQNLAEKIATILKNAKNPLIVSGVHSGDERMVQAALNMAKALSSVNKNCMLSMVLPESNSMGLAMMPGKSLDDLASLEEIDTLVVLENDLYRRASEKSVNALFEKSKKVIVLDHLINKTTQRADLLLPAATFVEAEGTLVSHEGRAQRFYKALPDKEPVMESWRWIGEMIQAKEQKQEATWKRFDDLVASLTHELPVFDGLEKHMPDADFRMLNEKVPRQTLRYSGRTSMNAKVAVSETRITLDEDSPLTFSMEGQSEMPPSSLTPFYWTPGWNSVQALYGYLDEPNGSMKGGDPGIRLIEPAENDNTEYFKEMSSTSENHERELQIVPVYQIFGSEELSTKSPALAKRIKDPFIYLNPEDAKAVGVDDDELVHLEIDDNKLEIKVKIENSLPKGVVGMAKNFPEMPFVMLPGYGRFKKINS